MNGNRVIAVAEGRTLPVLTREKQQAMAEHIQYEVDEFRAAFRDLPGLTGRHFLWNRAIESVLLHFRNLRDFFFLEYSKHYPDDVTALEYIPKWMPEKDSIFADTKVRIDKRLAHLTICRLSLKADWPELDQMNAAIENLIREFGDSLSAEQQSWFPRLEQPRVRVMLGAADNSTVSASRDGRLFLDRF